MDFIPLPPLIVHHLHCKMGMSTGGSLQADSLFQLEYKIKF